MRYNVITNPIPYPPHCDSQAALEAFWNFELPEDIVQGYGCGQVLAQAKRKILGENLARLHGMDVAAKKRELGLTTREAGA